MVNTQHHKHVDLKTDDDVELPQEMYASYGQFQITQLGTATGLANSKLGC
jgi:fatty acid desaturase